MSDVNSLFVQKHDLRTLLICSFRYSLGRQTYMPGLIQELIQQYHDDVLLPSDLQQFANDIDDYARGNESALGDEGDAKGWRRFQAWCRENNG